MDTTMENPQPYSQVLQLLSRASDSIQSPDQDQAK